MEIPYRYKNNEHVDNLSINGPMEVIFGPELDIDEKIYVNGWRKFYSHPNNQDTSKSSRIIGLNTFRE